MQMEVGIEDCLHIEFEYDKSRYHLSDTVVGKIYFLLVRIKLKHMEVCALQQLSTVLPACSAIELAEQPFVHTVCTPFTAAHSVLVIKLGPKGAPQDCCA